MLRNILAGLALASLLVGVIILILWWRSYSHIDHFSLGSPSTTKTDFTSRKGIVMVTTNDNVGGMILSQSQFYPFSKIIWGSLVIPGFWLAIWVRSKLPRPGRSSR